MSTDFDDELIKEFRIEAMEQLDNAEMSLLAVDKSGDFQSHYNSVFRTFHTIKGGAGMLYMNDVQKLVHHLENILVKIKPEKTFPKKVIDYLLIGVDATRDLLSGKLINFKLINPVEESLSAHKIPKKRKDVNVTSKGEKQYIGRVLIADDEKEQLSLMEEIVRNSGFDVYTFTNGTKLIEKAKESLPDVILTDLQMPEMNGLEILKEIQKINPDIPVVFLSGYASKEACMESLNNRAYAFIEKPVDPSKLINILINAAEKHKTMKLIDQSIKFIMYQFSDLDDFLIEHKKEDVREYIDGELHNILTQRRNLKKIKLNAVL